MTFEELQKANSTIKTRTLERKDKKTGEIKRTEYADVNQRIKAFRMLYPDGTILTEMVSDNGERCVFKATVTNMEGNIIGSGHAFEEKGASFINATSYIENCETSAVGRALAMCGIGIDTSIASYEEVANAMKNQESNEERAAVLKELNDLCVKAKFKKADFDEKFGKMPSDMTVEELKKAVAIMKG